jgi:ketosteroid isomerase-like protein
MSDPLSIVQSAYAAFGRGDIPAVLEMLAEDASWQFVGDRSAPYTGRFDGRARIGEWFAVIAQVDAIQVFEPREFFVGPDHVTVLGRERTAAVPSGKVFECEWVHVFGVHDGRISRFWGMLDSEASAAARQ